jgi:hypothetical protein
MREIACGICLVLVCALFAGCAPQDSLFPLFSSNDNAFENQLLGEWTVQGGTGHIKPGDKAGTAIFEKSSDGVSYALTVPDFGEDARGQKVISAARMVRLGPYLFMDLGSPDLDSTANATIPYPSIEGHVFGRVYLEKDTMHIDFLSDKWISDQAKAGKLTLANVTVGNLTVLSATTEELRKFALQYAEDKEVFSETFAFQRKK